MTRRAQPEAQIQRAVIEHIAWRARPCVFAFHVPSGGWRSPIEARILQSIGTVAGIPDILCIFQGHCYALELKAGRGRLTDVQRVVHERLGEAGADVAVAHGIDQALAQLEGRRQLLTASLATIFSISHADHYGRRSDCTGRRRLSGRVCCQC